MKKQRRRNNKKNTNNKNPAGGDIPVRPKRTYETVSAPFPRATDTVRIHSTAAATITATPTTPITTTYNFNLSASNATAGNFDQYRLMAVRFSIVPNNNAIGLVTNSSTGLVPVYCVIDYDDTNALASASAAEGYNNCIVLNPGESLSRTFRPRMALAAYSGAFASYANVEPLWIDASSNGVQHYGIKLYIPGVLAAQTLLQSWNIIVEYCWELRANLS